MRKYILVVSLLLSILFSACSESTVISTSNLMANIQKNDSAPIDMADPKAQDDNRKEEITEFSLKLFVGVWHIVLFST